MFEEDDLQVMQERKHRESEAHYQPMLGQKERTLWSLQTPTPLDVKPPPDSSWSLPPPATGMLPVPKVFPPSKEFVAPSSTFSMPVPRPMTPPPIPDPTHPEPACPPQPTKPTPLPTPPKLPKPKPPQRDSYPTRSMTRVSTPSSQCKNPCRANRFEGIYSKYLSSC